MTNPSLIPPKDNSRSLGSSTANPGQADNAGSAGVDLNSKSIQGSPINYSELVTNNSVDPTLFETNTNSSISNSFSEVDSFFQEFMQKVQDNFSALFQSLASNLGSQATGVSQTVGGKENLASDNEKSSADLYAGDDN